MAWRWNARRLIVSAFVIFHLSAICLWTMPPCYIKDHLEPFYRYYVLPTGMWQWWAIFAPDPVRDTMVLDAEIVDAKGMRHIYEFPRIAELPWWQKIPRYRQPKFTGNMAKPEYDTWQEVHRPLRGAADGSKARGISSLGEPLLSDQGYAAAECDGRLRPDGSRTHPHARAIRVCLDRGGEANESHPGMESLVLRPGLGSPARCLSHRLRRAHVDVSGLDAPRIRPLVHRGRVLEARSRARRPARFAFPPFSSPITRAISYAVWAVTTAAAVGLTLGWRTRIMSVLLYLGMITLYHRNVMANGGPDAVPLLLSFYMMFCPSGAACSLDAMRAARKRGTVRRAADCALGIAAPADADLLDLFPIVRDQVPRATLAERHVGPLRPLQS